MKAFKLILSVLPFLLLIVELQQKSFIQGIIILLVGYGLHLLMPCRPGVLNFLALICGEILTRFVVTVSMGRYLITTTSVSEFISAMERLHLLKAITIPMSVMFRMILTIGEEWQSIRRRAMGMRGIHLGGVKVG